MCELFAMSARRPTSVARSLALLRPRGGATGPHGDGWGVALFQGSAAGIFKDSSPAASSACFAALEQRDLESDQVVAHLRRANPPELVRSWANTHPFERELAGRSWVFAHNGRLPGIHADPRFRSERFHPLGDTDSELAFCFLLQAIHEAASARGPFDPSTLVAALRDPVASLAGLGEFNFVLANGTYLVVHAHTRLHALRRVCREDGCDQVVTLVATLPLTGEDWHPLAQSSLHVLAAGEEVLSTRMLHPSASPRLASNTALGLAREASAGRTAET